MAKQTQVEKDTEELKELCSELLAGANLLMEKEAMIQPFYSIVLKHAVLIGKLNLMGVSS